MRPMLALLLAASALADSYAPYGERSFDSPDGGHRLRTREGERHQLEFELVETGSGTVVARGLFPDLPEDVHVLNGGAGAVLFEKYAHGGQAHAAARLDAKGAPRWTVRLSQLFDRATIEGFPNRMGNMLWHRAWWVDEGRGKVVLVARGGLLREVDLADGAIATPASAVLLAGIQLPWAREKALEVAAELVPAGLRPLAEPLAADKAQSIDVRLRAAVAVHAAGGPVVPSELWTAALAQQRDAQAKRFALAQVAAHMGEGALAFLEQAATRDDLAYHAVVELARAGAEGSRALVGLLSHERVADEVKEYALGLLRKQEGGPVLDAVLRELEDAGDNPVLAGRLVRAAVATGSEEVTQRLRQREHILLLTLNRQTGPLDWLAAYFQVYPSTEAVNGLLQALAQYRANAALRPRLIAALKACTGLDYGDDVDAWLRGVPVR